MKLTKPFYGVPDGEIYPRTYEAGEECPPELLESAIYLGAVASEEEKPKAKAK